MFHTLITKATSVLLATMLGATTVAPPAIRHTHPPVEEGHFHHRHDANSDPLHRHSHHAGERGHRHFHHAGERGHRHSHHAGERGWHQPDAYGCDIELAGGHWWHLHFHFLGFEFTLPEPAPDQGDRESYGTDAVSILSLAQEAVFYRTAQNASTWQMIPPSKAVAPEDAALLQVVVTAPPPVSCPPLCDRARRERSGVLIA